MARIAAWLSFALTALMIPITCEVATSFLTITATFWTPKISFGSFSTAYFPPASCASVEKTLMQKTFFWSSAWYVRPVAMLRYLSFVSLYTCFIPRNPSSRFLDSGQAPREKLFGRCAEFCSRLESQRVFRWYFLASAFRTAIASTSKNGVAFDNAYPSAARRRLASSHQPCAVFGSFVWWYAVWSISPMYSGYALIFPLRSAVWMI